MDVLKIIVQIGSDWFRLGQMSHLRCPKMSLVADRDAVSFAFWVSSLISTKRFQQQHLHLPRLSRNVSNIQQTNLTKGQ